MGRVCLFLMAAVLMAGIGSAQPTALPGRQTSLASGLPVGFEGPPTPTAPDVIARDASGRVTIRAVRMTGSLSIDGRLDEAVYDDTTAISGFIQNDPAEGEPANEKTEVWLFFDCDNVYVVARCWESQPARITATEMRRDNFRIVRDDNFAWSFDTFYDRRNNYICLRLAGDHSNPIF